METSASGCNTPFFHMPAIFVVGDWSDLWNPGVPQTSGASGNHMWMLCEWFLSCFNTSLERLGLGLRHMFAQFRQLQWGRERLPMTLLVSLCIWALEKWDLYLWLCLLLSRKICCFIALREYLSEFVGHMWNPFPCKILHQFSIVICSTKF